MRLDIGDGYTLPFSTSPDVRDAVSGEVIRTNLPVVTGRYRPALFHELNAYRYRYTRATTAAEQADSIADFVAEHVVDWDVTAGPQKAKVSPAVVLRMPEPIVEQLLRILTTWAPREQAEAEKNS